MKATLMLLLLAPLASATTPIVISPQIKPVVTIKSPNLSPALQSFTGPIVVPPNPYGGGGGVPQPTCPPPSR